MRMLFNRLILKMAGLEFEQKYIRKPYSIMPLRNVISLNNARQGFCNMLVTWSPLLAPFKQLVLHVL